MYKFIVAIICFVSLFSCQKKLANFQASNNDFYKHSEKPIAVIKTKEIIYSETELKNNDVSLNVELLTASVEEEPFLKNKQKVEIYQTDVINFKNDFNAKNETIKKLELKKEKYKKKKRKKLKLNDNIKIGMIFLLVAIGLSIVGLNQLVLIFGIASIVFLYLGLKKYYRRRRIKRLLNL
jgi:hypothetical protein